MSPRRSLPTVIIYWDYDTQWGADRSRSKGGPKTWGAAEFTLTDRVLELHHAFGLPACFAVVGAAALPGERPYHDPDQIRRIHAAGHEIASHSQHHEWLPGLGEVALRDTLLRSKQALEQCIGGTVVSFVPPYNQPFDYWQGWSFSLSERRATNGVRTDLGQLCSALRDTGYLTCRVSYRPMHLRLAEAVVRRRLDRPTGLDSIGGVTCVRLNTPGGFGPESVAVVRRAASSGGIVGVYAHPHSLSTPGTQHEDSLVEFLRLLRELQDAGRVRVRLPRDLVEGG